MQERTERFGFGSERQVLDLGSTTDMEEKKKQQPRQQAQNPHRGHPRQHYMSEAEYYARQYVPYGYYAGAMQQYHHEMSQYYG